MADSNSVTKAKTAGLRIHKGAATLRKKKEEFHILFSEHLRTAGETKSHFHANIPSTKNVRGQKIWRMNNENQV